MKINTILNWTYYNKYIKTNITKDILHVIKKISNDEKLTNEESINYFIMRNCDVMGHINKGTIGVRLGSSVNCNLKNIYIQNISNNGIINNDLEYYKNTYNITNVKVLDAGSDGIKNLSGNYAIGLISSGISKGKFNKLLINNIISTNSKGIGLFVNNESYKLNIKKTIIKNINSNNEINDCATILIDEKAKKINLTNITLN